MSHSWTDICAVADLPAQGGRYVEIGNRALAVFKLPNSAGICVTDDSCPHAGGSLSAGAIDRTDCVICPMHAWAFNLHDGKCPDNPAIAVRTYRVRVVNGRVEAQL